MEEQGLRGERIRLRAVEPGDVEFIYGMENDPSIWHVGDTLVPLSRFQIEQYALGLQHDIHAEKQLRLMIELALTGKQGKVIGAVDLYDFDPHHLRAGIGILISGEEQNRGFGSEALALMIRYSFETLNLHQLYCSIFPDNLASLALFEKHGFTRCGVLKEWRHFGNRWHDVIMYQLIR